MNRLLLILTITLFAACPALAQVGDAISESDIPALLEQVMKNQRRQDRQLTEYTAVFKFTLRSYDKKGKITEEEVITGETYQSQRRNVDINLTKNGKPLSPGKIEKERNQAVKALGKDSIEREKVSESQKSADGPEYAVAFNSIRFSSYLFLRYSDVFNPRKETLDGRAMIALDFRPRPNLIPPNKFAAPLSHLAGTVWVDAADKITTKIVARLAKPTDKLAGKDDTAFVQEFTRMPEGVWLFKYLRVNPAVKPEYFNGMNSELISERSNFQRFTVRAEDPKLADQKKP